VTTDLLRTYESPSPAFDEALGALRHRGVADLARVEPEVRAILEGVRRGGDEAVLRYGERFDGRRAAPLVLRPYDGAGALARLEPRLAGALREAAARIRAFHERQRDPGFRYEEGGVALGQRVRPVARAGVYAPGGKARYPSSVLMAAIPARVAGVPEIVVATPRPDDLVLAACHLAGVSAVVDAGGAQAVGALAYGTESVPRVDKIVGPGNLYVTCAKRLVIGHVSIDGLAGPSEILVVADGTADPVLVAADLLSQAEHDEEAYPLLVTTEPGLPGRVAAELARQLAPLPRAPIARAALLAHAAAFVVPTRERLIEVASELAVEHVALHVERADEAFEQMGPMGAAFVGHATPEAAGDYVAGPSHVLPTGGAVRFGSPLGVYDFVTRASYVRYSPEALRAQAETITTLARAEGLEAHARAVELRLGRGG
jgi:histidinol dehydrogenase